MKKSLIALAVAGAMTAPMIAQADATLYGRFSVEAVKLDDTDLNITDEIGGRVGIKGDVDLGLDGTKGIFHGEWSAKSDDGEFGGARLAYIGATGDWGTITTGRQYVPHWIMNSNAYVARNPLASEHGFLGNFLKRNSNTFAYTTPNMNGLTVAAAIVADGQSEAGDHETVDAVNVAAKYVANGLSVAASYANVEEDGSYGADIDVWGISAKYKMDALTVMGRYEDLEAGDNESDAISLGVNYKIDNTVLKAGWTQIDENSEDGDVFVLEAAQIMGKGEVYVGYTNFDDVTRAAGGGLGFNRIDDSAAGDNDAYYVGYLLNF